MIRTNRTKLWVRF